MHRQDCRQINPHTNYTHRTQEVKSHSHIRDQSTAHPHAANFGSGEGFATQQNVIPSPQHHVAADFGSGEGFATQNVIPSPCNIMPQHSTTGSGCRLVWHVQTSIIRPTAGCRVAGRGLQLGTAVRKLLAISHLRHTFYRMNTGCSSGAWNCGCMAGSGHDRWLLAHAEKVAACSLQNRTRRQ